jgi:hypothetical protein
VGFKHAFVGYTRKSVLFLKKERSLSAPRWLAEEQSTERRGPMGLLELLLIVLVVAAVAGGIGLSPLLWLLLLVALVVFLTSGGFGYRRGGRI